MAYKNNNINRYSRDLILQKKMTISLIFKINSRLKVLFRNLAFSLSTYYFVDINLKIENMR